jgi:hypothetical protein
MGFSSTSFGFGGSTAAAKIPANLSFYSTTTPSDIPGYLQLVTNITDPAYNDPAVNVPTGSLSIQNQLLSSLAAAPSIFTGNPGVITIQALGEIRRTSGTGVAEFYFEAFHRDALGTETLIGTSNTTAPVSQSVYTQFQASLLFNNGVFTASDRLVLKFYGNRIAGGSNPQYDFLFGGTNPVRTLFPIPAGLITSGSRTVKSDWQSPYNYIGSAPQGTPEAAPIWFITRITVNIDGTTVVETATGAWTNRYSLIYT